MQARFIEVFVCYHLKSLAVNKEVGPTHLLTLVILFPLQDHLFFIRRFTLN